MGKSFIFAVDIETGDGDTCDRGTYFGLAANLADAAALGATLAKRKGGRAVEVREIGQIDFSN
jgi:hypothetical protein